MQKTTQSSNLKEYSRTQEKRYTEEYEEEYTTTQTSPQSDFFVFALIGFVLESVAISLEVILRKNFGSRYFTPFKFSFGLVLVSLLTSMSFVNLSGISLFGYLNMLKDSSFSEPNEFVPPTILDINYSKYIFTTYLFCYIILGVNELKRAFERERDGKAWHSYFTGQSRFTFFDDITDQFGLKSYLGTHLVANHIVQLYIEPLFLFILGVSLIPVFPLVGAWISTGSIAVFVKGQITYSRIKKQVWDMKDSRIESKYMVKALEGTEPSTTAGLTTLAIRPNITQINVNRKEAIDETFKKNPELAKMAGIETYIKEAESSTVSKTGKN